MIVLCVRVKEIDIHGLLRLLLDIWRAPSSSIELISIEEHVIMGGIVVSLHIVFFLLILRSIIITLLIRILLITASILKL